MRTFQSASGFARRGRSRSRSCARLAVNIAQRPEGRRRDISAAGASMGDGCGDERARWAVQSAVVGSAARLIAEAETEAEAEAQMLQHERRRHNPDLDMMAPGWLLLPSCVQPSHHAEFALWHRADRSIHSSSASHRTLSTTPQPCVFTASFVPVRCSECCQAPVWQ